MNYNIVIIVNIIICAIISMLIAYYGTSFFMDEKNMYFKITQLVLTIVLMMTIYAPFKYILLKYMDVDESLD